MSLIALPNAERKLSNMFEGNDKASLIVKNQEDSDDEKEEVLKDIKILPPYQKKEKHNFKVLKLYSQKHQRHQIRDHETSGMNVTVEFEFNFDVYKLEKS